MTSTSNRFSELPDAGFIRQSQLIREVVPFSAATLWREVKAGTFPAPVKLTLRITAWRVEDVRKWIQSRTVTHMRDNR